MAPQVVHVDEARRAILSEFVVERGFVGLFANPATREGALALVGGSLRRVHALPLPVGAGTNAGESLIASSTAALDGFPLPVFFHDATQRALTEKPPPCDRAIALSHNDVNPSNVVYDGANVLLFDWDAGGPNDPLYDLAAIAVFLRLDDAMCQRLIAIHDEAQAAALPARLLCHRRFIPSLCARVFMRLARKRGHAGATGDETLESTPALGEIYQRMRSGAVNLATPEPDSCS